MDKTSVSSSHPFRPLEQLSPLDKPELSPPMTKLYEDIQSLDQKISTSWDNYIYPSKPRDSESSSKVLDEIFSQTERLGKLTETFRKNLTLAANSTDKKVQGLAKEILDLEISYLQDRYFASKEQLKEARGEISEPQFEDLKFEEKEELAVANDPNLKTFLHETIRPHFTLVPTEGDGNCLLRAVVKTLDPSLDLPENKAKEDEGVQKLRGELVKYMEGNKKDYEATCVHNPNKPDEEVSFDTYLKELGKDETWLDEQNVKALAEMLKVPIYVYRAQGVISEQGTILPSEHHRQGIKYLSAKNPIEVYFRKDHYVKLIRKSPFQTI